MKVRGQNSSRQHRIRAGQVRRKRKSLMSYSVVGRDLRKKRRLNKAPMGPAVRRIQVEDESTEDIELANFEGEIRKEDVFKFYCYLSAKADL